MSIKNSVSPDHRFYLKYKGNASTMKVSAGKFILEKGSYISLPNLTFIKNNNSYYKMSVELSKQSIDGNRILLKDVELTSPTAAASIANGRETNGKTDWVDEEGISVGDYMDSLKEYDAFDLNDFKSFYESNKGDYISDENLSHIEKLITDFQKEYPIERLKDLSLEDYCLGTSNYQQSLSHKLEFGVYKHVGMGIGGGTSKKFGIYASVDNQYINRSGIITDVETFWKDFKQQLYDLMMDFATANDTFYTYTRYPLLKGMSMVLTKLLFLYYPDKFISIASRPVIVKIFKMFNFEFDDTLPTEQLSFILCKKMRAQFPGDEFYTGYLGHALWKYLLSIAPSEEDEDNINYWVYTPGKDNGSQWENFYSNKIMAIWNDVGNILEFASKTELKDEIKIREELEGESSLRNRVLARWQFAHEMKIGDIVFAKRGRTTLLGKGVIRSDYKWDPEKGDYASYRDVEWMNKGEWDLSQVADDTFVLKQLTNITKYEGYADKLEQLIHPQIITKKIEYNKESFLKDVFMSDEKYESIRNLLERKKNIILQGSPGVGKTFMAKRLMYTVLNEAEDTNIETIQFHQSYSYEDFIQGFRPTDDGQFELKDGLFYRLVTNARKDLEINKENAKKYCIIIDEINRGNLSKIFGEIMMLIESDKRHPKWKLSLTYSSEEDEKFYVPENLFIIGTMNTADRSLAMVDYALRRRFAFIDLEPAFGTSQFTKFMTEDSNLPVNFVTRLNESYIQLNEFITEKIGKGFVIGHSYFIDQFKNCEDINQGYQEILQFEIKPLLEEYFFQDKDKIAEALEIVDFEI